MQNFKYYTIDPPAELSAYVRCFWVFEGNNLTDLPYVYRSMADACAEMVFHYKAVWDGISLTDETIAGTNKLTALQSPSDNFKRFVTNQDFGIFGAYLYPYAVNGLFGLSSLELRNELASLEDCIGNAGRTLEEQIITARDNRHRVSLITEFLLSRMRQAKSLDRSLEACIKHIIHRPTQLKIEQTAALFCISERQLERKFKTITGFTPKSFSRISRFQHALRRYGSSYKNLTDLAYESGYYDQSHFIHDFKKFSGYEPRTYFSGNAEGIEYKDS